MLPIISKARNFFRTLTAGDGYSLHSKCSLDLDLRKKSDPASDAGHFTCGWDRSDDLKKVLLCIAAVMTLLAILRIIAAVNRRLCR